MLQLKDNVQDTLQYINIKMVIMTISQLWDCETKKKSIETSTMSLYVISLSDTV